MEKLSRERDFKRLFEHGKTLNGEYLVFRFFFRDEGASRLGIITGKKLGKSTVRNRVRRRIREIARFEWAKIKHGVDLVVVARAGSIHAGFEKLKREFTELLRKGRLFRGEASNSGFN